MGKERPFKKLYCDRRETFQLPDSAFKLWMYLYVCENVDRKAWPSAETIAENCNLSVRTVRSQRRLLTKFGWLRANGVKSFKNNQFNIPVYTVTRGVIDPEWTEKSTPAKSYRGKNLPFGGAKNDHLGVQKTAPKVDSYKKNIEEEEKTVSFKNNIILSCRKILKVRLQPNDPAWSELKTLAQIHGVTVVESAFEQWAENLEDTPAHPLTSFASKADTILEDEERELQTDKTLIRELSEISKGRIRFSKKNAAEVSQFLKEFTADEIKSAFREFVGTVREDKLEWAAKDFSETADQIIVPMRSEKKLMDAALAEIARIESTSVVVPEEQEPFEL